MAYIQGHVYTDGNICAAFLANYDDKADATVTFREQSYHLPAWSVSILPDCKNVIYNTAQVLNTLDKHFKFMGLVSING